MVAALIRKFVEAKKENSPTVDCWGSGKPIREFLYVGDAAEGIVRATERYDETDPLNIGTGIGTTIKDLANLISSRSGFRGEIIWDTSKLEGTSEKTFSVTRMKELLKWKPKTSLAAGLKRTIRWFAENYENAINRW